MNEKILHFVWKYKLFDDKQMTNSDGLPVKIQKPGIHSFDAGPDFVNAQIKIGNTLWAGNIEMHINASDWDRHKHHQDKAYNNVILHVVVNNDKVVYNENGDKVAALELELSPSVLNKYKNLLQTKEKPACKNELKKIDQFKLKIWFSNLLFERLDDKTNVIEQKLISNKNNWEEAFYQTLARSYGFNLNAEPFERLARSIPLKFLAKHQDNLLQLEALLFGQAGFLQDDINENYYNDLKKEYSHLQKKFGLRPIEKHSWKFLRSRPTNFPTVRIAQFAMLIYKSKSLFSKIINANSISEIKNLFQLKTSTFWINHYTFEKISSEKEKHFGNNSLNNIIINTIVPFTLLYGKLKGNQSLKDKSIALLEELKPENNHITRIWESAGIKVDNAFLSQAVIQQTKTYCQKEKCLDCGIGLEILKQSYSENDKE